MGCRDQSGGVRSGVESLFSTSNINFPSEQKELPEYLQPRKQIMSIYATLAFNLKNVFSAVNKTTVMVTLEYI